ncbi:MAG TPA: pyridoxamine 5'-phosphate oxidase family protein [Candidatus Dormibacteraeota bacterium]|nr:pyridoxamine 5'-phosphate oxidase family protein [Candidatus Dormibacteraeota bacterium]
MATTQGSVQLLEDPVAEEMLRSTTPARLAYSGLDGKPRVVPIWFHWTGEEVVLGTPPKAPKVQALLKHPEVAISIDGDAWPYKVLQIRGAARLETVDDIIPEYSAAAKRYFGSEQGQAWVEQLRKMGQQKMVRISVRPKWVGILDFVTRFPKALT